MARVFLLSLVLAAVAVAISDASLERRERQLRSLYGGAGGGAGQPGQPGGLFGGGGGGGGGGGYFGGGAGGGAGQPGMPGGMNSDYDAAFTEEDLLSILAHAAKKPKSEIKTKVKIGPKCKNVSGVTDFIDGKHKKKEWLTYLHKLIDDGNNECAEDLSEQLLEQ